MNVSSRRVLVTGGSGFLGRHVIDALRRHGCRDIVVVRKAQHDLTSHDEHVHVRPEEAIEGFLRTENDRFVFVE